jgi:hypothetical protein
MAGLCVGILDAGRLSGRLRGFSISGGYAFAGKDRQFYSKVSFISPAH